MTKQYSISDFRKHFFDTTFMFYNLGMMKITFSAKDIATKTHVDCYIPLLVTSNKKTRS